ncbi:dsRBD fold-containing protein [Streptomyces sp. Da 82-17]|uniref:dsRBD fold-containing protein n=1 Tax=Streptomyces sp. Da 82-17 TaxID=3377116 RepID=UPI0038D4B0E3
MSHTTDWQANVHLVEKGRTTKVQVDLDTGSSHLTGKGMARRNPSDREVPEIGDELATARALENLAQQLKRTAYHDMAAAGQSREQTTDRPYVGWPDASQG